MDDKIIDGRKLAAQHAEALKIKIQQLGVKIKIISLLIGDDPASILYSNIKQKKAAELGIEFELKQFPASASSEQIIAEIGQLNQDQQVSGIMIQMPVPEAFLQGRAEETIFNEINPQKDVDGLRADSPFTPATVKGVLSILESEGISVNGKIIAVVGATGMVGTPLVKLLEAKGAQVIKINSKTVNLCEEIQKGEIVISAVGKKNLITADCIKDGAVVIDIGGDVDFDNVIKKASRITPPKGGVGPMTVVSLMENAVEAT